MEYNGIQRTFSGLFGLGLRLCVNGKLGVLELRFRSLRVRRGMGCGFCFGLLLCNLVGFVIWGGPRIFAD